MPLNLTPLDLLLRLLATLVAGALVGINRGERGRPAGLRTTMLVCSAASFSMLLANGLLSTAGKPPSSFVQLDVMRLPLGVLTGVGFLGAGAIVRKGSIVVGLTTAATLWFVTMMGLCFGAGKYALGAYSLGVALLIIWGLKHLEKRARIDRRGSLRLEILEHGPSETQIRQLFDQYAFEIAASGLNVQGSPRAICYRYELIWRASPDDTAQPPFLSTLLADSAVTRVDWSPQILEEQAAGG